MLFEGFHEDEDVVQVHHHYSFRNEFLKNVVHHGLEGGGAVSEAEEHHQWFKESTVGAEGGLPFISFFYADIIETPSDNQPCEVSRPVEFLYQFGDEREWVFVLYCDGIQSTVVLYQAEGSIFLFDEEDWRGHRGFGRSDVASFQIFLEEGIEFLLFGRGEQVDLTSRWGPSRDEFYGMIPRLGSGRTSKDSLENTALNSLR